MSHFYFPYAICGALVSERDIAILLREFNLQNRKISYS